jgi:hypothetical protein
MKLINFQNSTSKGYLYCNSSEYHLIVAKLLQYGYELVDA